MRGPDDGAGDTGRRRAALVVLLLVVLLMIGGVWAVMRADDAITVSDERAAPTTASGETGTDSSTTERGAEPTARQREHVAVDDAGAEIFVAPPGDVATAGGEGRERPRAAEEPGVAPGAAPEDPEEPEPAIVVVHVTRDGQPVEGARVLIAPDWKTARKPIEAGTTGKDGSVSVEVPSGVPIEAYATRDDAPIARSDVVVPVAGSPRAVQVAFPDLEVAGVAVDATTGEPLAGVRIDVRQVADLPAQGGVHLVHRTQAVHSAEDGTFSARALAPGRVELVVEPVANRLPWSARQQVEAGAADVRLEVLRSTVVRLVAEDAGTGEPLTELDLRAALRQADGALTAIDNSMHVSGHGVWPPDGCFELPGPGPHRLHVYALGYAPGIGEVAASADPVEECRVVLRPDRESTRPRLELTIVDERGRSVEDAEIMLTQGRGSIKPICTSTPGGRAGIEVYPGPNSLKVGTWLLSEGAGPWNTVDVEVVAEPGETLRRTVTLKACGGIELPAIDGTMRAHRGDEWANFARSFGDGETTRCAGPIRTGTWTVTVRTPQGPRRGEVVVRQGRLTRVDPERDLQPFVDESDD